MKVCSKCKEEKNLEGFYKRKGKPRPECKSCTLEVNKATINKDAKLKAQASYRDKNREALRQKSREWKKANRGLHNAQWAKYHTTKLKATPAWADQEQIKRIYVACAKITKQTGIEHHVDHIIPLQGENVCGLHVENNLAIIPAKMNLRKSNRF